MKGDKIMSAFTGLLSLHEAALIWNIDDSTIRKAIEFGRLVDGYDCCKFGKQWVVTRSAMMKVFGHKYDCEKLHEYDCGKLGEFSSQKIS